MGLRSINIINLKYFLIILILFLSVTVVSATDINNTDISAAADDSLVVEYPDFLQSSEIQDSKVLSSSTPGTFDDLQTLVNNAGSGSVLKLTKDYKGDKNKRIQLNKDLTIDGNGHTIDCLDKSGCSAFYSKSGIITLKNLKIINGHNNKDDKGGAIYFTNKAKYTIINCTFENNNAEKGGAIYSTGDLFIENSTFKNNHAKNYGGAIYAGAVYINVNQKDQTFSSFFINNKVGEWHGGAIYVKDKLKAVNTVFSGNKALVCGGAVYSEDDIYVTRCLFNDNKADGAKIFRCYGGALMADDAVVDNCTFRNNYADNTGGAIQADTLILTASVLEFNTARQCGGAIFVNKFKEDVVNNIFIGNKQKKGDDGGAIYIYEENHITFSKNVFIDNTCGHDGGVIYLDSIWSKLTLKNNIFIGNSAGNSGDSVYNTGKYSNIVNNYWGEKNPLNNNNQLIEWKFWKSDKHHDDDDPLVIDFRVDSDALEGIVKVIIIFYKSDGSTINPQLNDMVVYYILKNLFNNDAIKFNQHKSKIGFSSASSKFGESSYSDGYSISADFVPQGSNLYNITFNLAGQTLSKTLKVVNNTWAESLYRISNSLRYFNIFDRFLNSKNSS